MTNIKKQVEDYLWETYWDAVNNLISSNETTYNEMVDSIVSHCEDYCDTDQEISNYLNELDIKEYL